MPAASEDGNDKHHVVIVGAGMAGLMAAEELLKRRNDVRVTMVESCSQVGGRVLALRDFVEGHVIDLGAEYIHGKDTLLTRVVNRYAPRWKHHAEPLTEEQFISSYADGGPSPTPTKDGKVGMFYCDGELMEFNDARLHPLERVLGTLEDFPGTTESTSIADVVAHLPPHLHSMAVAGYGNTAGCTRLDSLSLSMINAFEEYWGEVEEEGDERLNSRIGMSGIVVELLRDLQKRPDFELRLNWAVTKVETVNDGARLVSESGDVICGDSALVTCPTKYWSDIMNLPSEKAVATEYVGEEKAIKVMAKFDRLLWRQELQSLICADGLPVPEIWFRDFEDSHLAVGFLTSDCAEDFLKAGNGDQSKITEILLNQLSTVLKISRQDLEAAHLETRMHVWDVGYMFPKVGMQPQHLEALAKPYENIYFAGEATHTGACCTVQAAMETGVRAAKQIMQKLE